jgi:DNA-binding response OmpR family regulator
MSAHPVLLFVEDEPLLHQLLEPILVHAGFEVAGATRGEQALLMLRRHDTDFCALVTDVNLGPGPTGWDVARVARELVVDLPVIYATANPGDEFDAQAVDQSLLVRKPYAPETLVTAVETLVSARAH